MPKKHWFIETDGRVFLVFEDGIGRLPSRVEEIPFPIEVREVYEHRNQEIQVATPLIDYYPKDWAWKDEIPYEDGVDALVRSCVHQSMTRNVVKTAFIEDGKILLVKCCRGLFDGKWILPGGYMQWGESPEEGAIRENREELGVDTELGELVFVQSKVFPGGNHFISFFYTGKLLSHDFDLPESEISEARWYPLAEAVGITASVFDAAGIDRLR